MNVTASLLKKELVRLGTSLMKDYSSVSTYKLYRDGKLQSL